MTAVLNFLIQADSTQARIELDRMKSKVTGVGDDTQKFGKATKTAAAGTKVMASGSRMAASEVSVLAAAERSATQAAIGMNGANKVAAGNMGNLVAQFNDIGVMMAAGQNPLQLALQQGTQVTQVIGPMGAAGAFSALGSALVSMFNPISIITIGSIAAGAAMIGWLRDAWPEAESLGEAMEGLADSTDRYADASARALKTSSDLIDDFGSKSVEMRAQLRRDAELERANAMRDLRSSAGLMTEAFGGLSRDRFVFSSSGLMMTEIEATMSSIRDEFGLTTKDAARLTSTLEWMNSAKTPAENIDAANAFSDALFSIFKSAENIPDELKNVANAARQFRDASGTVLSQDEAEKRLAAERLKSAKDLLKELHQEVEQRVLVASFGEKSAQASNHLLSIERERFRLKVAELPLAAQLMAAWDEANPARDPFQERIASASQYYALTRQQSNLEVADAQERLATMREENAIQAAINQNGETSAQVIDLRAEAERRAFEATMETLDVSESLKEELRLAFQAGQDLAGLDLAAGVNSAAKAAADLADKLGISLEIARRVVKKTGEVGGVSTDPTVGGFEPNDPRSGNVDREEHYKRSWRPYSGNRRGAGASKQIDALALLIDKERTEIEILKTSDPVQKEMIRNRKALAGATKTEVQAVQSLIEERIRQEHQMEALRATYDHFGQTTLSVFDDLIVQGKSLEDVVANLAGSLASAALQATILGTGPLAGLFGTSGSGGLFGSIFGIPGFSEGGLIKGPGGPTEDRVLMYGSAGEFVVRASQVRKHKSLLDAVNSGAIDHVARYRDGGLVGPPVHHLDFPEPPTLNRQNAPGNAGQTAQNVVVELRLSSDLDARVAASSQAVAVRVVNQSLEEYSREPLVRLVQQIAKDDKAVG